MIKIEIGKIIVEVQKEKISNIMSLVYSYIRIRYLILFSFFVAILATIDSFYHGYILAYGDAESHINIAKRVVSALSPGLAQLGGIWEPLPHIMLVPFVASDFLWRTGLAGSIVFGACFVVASVFLYKLVFLLTKNKIASLIGFLLFIFNPNLLYLQSTPMTEIPLIMFSLLSVYFFAKYLYGQDKIFSLILAGLFGFFASLCRYDGWCLVMIEALAIVCFELIQKKSFGKAINRVILFGTLAFFGIVLWFLWNWTILGDPLYFNHSVYSSKSQQRDWLVRNELPAYKNLWVSFVYYFVDSSMNTGFFIFFAGLVGLFVFLFTNKKPQDYLIVLVLISPFLFNTITLYMGQTVIFVPSLTPSSFEWRLFNVRYGILMVPIAAIFFSFLFAKSNWNLKLLLIALFFFQTILFATGMNKTVSLQDGLEGLSSAKIPWDAENFLNKHYDGGLLLEDDFARSMSITRSIVPMQNIIYVGTKPYYEDSLTEPEKFARWIIMQKDDEIWKAIYDNNEVRGRLYKYFQKEYTSDRILIFRRMS